MPKLDWENCYNKIVKLDKPVKLGILFVVLRFFFISVFKDYYNVDVALTPEGINVLFIALSVLGVISVASKIIWHENEVVEMVTSKIYDIVHKTVLIALLIMTMASLYAIMNPLNS